MTEDNRRVRHAFAVANVARKAAANRRRIRYAERLVNAERKAWAERQLKAGDVAVQSAADPPPPPTTSEAQAPHDAGFAEWKAQVARDVKLDEWEDWLDNENVDAA